MYTSDKDELFYSKLDDAVNLCYIRQKPYFIPFLSESRQAAARMYLENVHFDNYSFYGGYEDAERKMLGLFYDDISDFPLAAVEFKYKTVYKLSHRDFLGAFMSLGIERNTVGDILVGNGRCVAFLKNELKDYVVSQISKVGNVGVKLSDADLSNLPKERTFEEISRTVSSLRLDNIVAALSGLSREKAKNFILAGNASINGLQNQNVSCLLSEKDSLTIRGKGKFILNNILGETKKGKIRISVIHFR